MQVGLNNNLLQNTINQLLFATTLFRYLLKKNWFAVINLSDLNVDYLKNIIPKTFKDSFVVRNIRDDEAFTNLAKISPM